MYLRTLFRILLPSMLTPRGSVYVRRPFLFNCLLFLASFRFFSPPPPPPRLLRPPFESFTLSNTIRTHIHSYSANATNYVYILDLSMQSTLQSLRGVLACVSNFH